MPKSVTLEDASLNLPQLIVELSSGDEVLITQGERVIAKLVGVRSPIRGPRPPPGLGKDSILYIAPDFDAPLEEFKEYM